MENMNNYIMKPEMKFCKMTVNKMKKLYKYMEKYRVPPAIVETKEMAIKLNKQETAMSKLWGHEQIKFWNVGDEYYVLQVPEGWKPFGPSIKTENTRTNKAGHRKRTRYD